LWSTSPACFGTKKIAVVSPDIGGAKRAEQFRRALAAELHEEPTAAFVEKRRSGGVVTGELLVGEVRDRVVIIFDDLISTGTTLQRAAERCSQAGATRIFAAATHGLFMEQVATVLADPLFEGIAVTDTIGSGAAAAGRLPASIVRLDSTKLFADAIMVAHTGR
jgi:ribose-phosphate pyrophosphokinase